MSSNKVAGNAFFVLSGVLLVIDGITGAEHTLLVICCLLAAIYFEVSEKE